MGSRAGFLSMPGIGRQTVGRPARSFVAIRTEMSQLLVTCASVFICIACPFVFSLFILLSFLSSPNVSLYLYSFVHFRSILLLDGMFWRLSSYYFLSSSCIVLPLPIISSCL